MAPEKRGRVVQRACDSCRSGKRKCDGLQVRTSSRRTRTARSPCMLMIPHFSARVARLIAVRVLPQCCSRCAGRHLIFVGHSGMSADSGAPERVHLQYRRQATTTKTFRSSAAVTLAGSGIVDSLRQWIESSQVLLGDVAESATVRVGIVCRDRRRRHCEQRKRLAERGAGRRYAHDAREGYGPRTTLSGCSAPCCEYADSL